MSNPTPFDVDEIWEHVEKRIRPDARTGCWNWTGATSTDGYGNVKWFGTSYSTHRLAYQANVGDVPEGLELDHLCRNRRCCNPQHLEAVTHAVNIARGVGRFADRQKQTHCTHGHEFTPENTYIKRTGTRECRTCKRLSARARRDRSA